MLSRSAMRSETAQPVESNAGPVEASWRDERIPLLGALPRLIPGTHPVEDEDDIVAVVEAAMADSVHTEAELSEWVNRQQLQMMRSGMLGSDGRSPRMAERTVRSLARYLAVRASIVRQISQPSE